MIARACRLWSREDGAVTVEFVILVPFFLVLLMSTFELGMLLTRQMMLDRALDLAVRQVRLGQVAGMTHDAFKNLICENAIVPDCERQIMLEMRQRDPRDWDEIDAAADCVDRGATGAPVVDFTPGRPNELMIVRACALFDPYFPTTGLGAELQRQDGGAYALVASSAYVVEPER